VRVVVQAVVQSNPASKALGGYYAAIVSASLPEVPAYPDYIESVDQQVGLDVVVERRVSTQAGREVDFQNVRLEVRVEEDVEPKQFKAIVPACLQLFDPSLKMTFD